MLCPPKSKKLISKPMMFFYLACAVGMSVLIYKFVYQNPEREQARDFLLRSQAIREEFGVLESVSFDTGSAAHISFRRDRREGTFPFKVTGSKKSGIVRVHWHSEGSGTNFIVDSVEFL